MMLGVSWETAEYLAAKSHAKHAALRWKDGKSYSCPPQHTAYTRYVRYLRFHWLSCQCRVF